MKQRVCKEDQIKLIMECRRSGLSDYQWCEKNGIHPGNFYNWVSKLRRSGYTFPESASKSNALPNVQEVVKVDLIPAVNQEPGLLTEQNVSRNVPHSPAMVAAELVVNNTTIRLFNGADEHLVKRSIRREYINISKVIIKRVANDNS